MFFGRKSHQHGLSPDNDEETVFIPLSTTPGHVEDEVAAEAAALVGSEEVADGAEVGGSGETVEKEGEGDNVGVAGGENEDVNVDLAAGVRG